MFSPSSLDISILTEAFSALKVCSLKLSSLGFLRMQRELLHDRGKWTLLEEMQESMKSPIAP